MNTFIHFCLFLIPLYAYAGELPDITLTPGVARVVTKDELCTTSTKLVRHTTSETKKEVYTEYGITPKHLPKCTGPMHSCYEVDHLIALEIGGADVKENLWPQEYEIVTTDKNWQKNGAHKKDELENALHKKICAGTITIQQAQDCISSDWVKCYESQLP